MSTIQGISRESAAVLWPNQAVLRHSPIQRNAAVNLAIMALSLLSVGVTVYVWPSTWFIILGTLASEDLTCIGTGLLIQNGTIDWLSGTIGCFVGIYVGDVAIWLLGRVCGRKILTGKWFSQRVDVQRLAALSDWFERYGWLAVLGSRFLPGVRIPLYFAIGMLGKSCCVFPVWSLVGVLIWVPTLVGFSVWIGERIIAPAKFLHGQGLMIAVLIGSAVCLKAQLTRVMMTSGKLDRLAIKLSKIWRWEFWPAWLFYLPMAPWIICLMVRYRSYTVWTAANPGIPHGGVIGESKFDILSQLPTPWRTPSAWIPSGELELRVTSFYEVCQDNKWSFPLILKPDVGQRGVGVKLIRNAFEAKRYLEEQTAPVIVQTYHPGPYEAGVFYVRMPGEADGKIFSITDKKFPIVRGDGASTLRELILNDSRYRLQSGVFFERHAADLGYVLGVGQERSLSIAGNHCQGTMFLDGRHLITPELEQRIDEIAKHFEGFFFGRFDVRYRSVEDFLSGRDLSIVELNGVTSESTNLYDPKHSLIQAYTILAKQWSILFRIGHENRRNGFKPTSTVDLVKLLMNQSQLVAKIAEIFGERRGKT